jgi:hypothetical protein
MIQRRVHARPKKSCSGRISKHRTIKTTLSRVTEDSKRALRARQRNLTSGGSTCLFLPKNILLYLQGVDERPPQLAHRETILSLFAVPMELHSFTIHSLSLDLVAGTQNNCQENLKSCLNAEYMMSVQCNIWVLIFQMSLLLPSSGQIKYIIYQIS